VIKLLREKSVLPDAVNEAFRYRLIANLKQLHPRFDNVFCADLDAPIPNPVRGFLCVGKFAGTPLRQARVRRHV
jgi:hypothetical protein